MQELTQNPLEDFCRNGIVWSNCNNILSESMFSLDSWKNIFQGITTYTEIDQFLSKGYGQCMVAHTQSDDTPFAFIFLFCESEKERKLSFHGGGWHEHNAKLNYLAAISLVEEMFDKGYRVRTSCLKSNKVAYRFIRSLGFINHYTSEYYHYFWTSYKRFTNTTIYKYFKSRACPTLGV